MQSPKRFLTRTKAIGLATMALAVIGGINTLFGGWDNAQRLAVRDWSWVGAVLNSPWLFVCLFVGGGLWVLFVGTPNGGRDWVLHRGLRWRWQDFNESAINPYPYCPDHDLRLLWEAVDKSRASWQKADIKGGMWFSGLDNGHLWCSHGHAITVPDPDRWFAAEAALEAEGLLERLGRRGRPAEVS